MEENTEIGLIRDDKGRLVKGTAPGPGRPKGSENFATKWAIFIDKVAKQNDMTPNEIDEQLLAVAFKKAKEGDYAFYRDTLDRVHGKPQQYVDHTTNFKDLPTPIMEIIRDDILPNDSNQENSEPKAEN